MDVRKMVKSALFAALISICAWIALPMGAGVFTLQTFGLFLTVLVLGGKWGTVSVGLYLLLGLVGLPVFSGFQGGFGVLFGPTGGYLPGFFLCALTYWLLTRLGCNRIFALVFGLGVCYGTACLWFWGLYQTPVFGIYILPYLLPDGIKLGAAYLLSRRLKPLAY